MCEIAQSSDGATDTRQSYRWREDHARRVRDLGFAPGNRELDRDREQKLNEIVGFLKENTDWEIDVTNWAIEIHALGDDHFWHFPDGLIPSMYDVLSPYMDVLTPYMDVLTPYVDEEACEKLTAGILSNLLAMRGHAPRYSSAVVERKRQIDDQIAGWDQGDKLPRSLQDAVKFRGWDGTVDLLERGVNPAADQVEESPKKPLLISITRAAKVAKVAKGHMSREVSKNPDLAIDRKVDAFKLVEYLLNKTPRKKPSKQSMQKTVRRTESPCANEKQPTLHERVWRYLKKMQAATLEQIVDHLQQGSPDVRTNEVNDLLNNHLCYRWEMSNGQLVFANVDD